MNALAAVHNGQLTVIDAHTHIFTPDVVCGRERYVGRDLWFEHLYANPSALLISAEEIIASMDAAGISCSIVCGFPWHDPGICREHNDYLAEACAGSNGRLRWLGIVSPLHGSEAAKEAERCLQRAAVGLGELNADAQRFDLEASRPLRDVVDVCRAHDRPLMLHATEPLGHAYPGKGSATPARLVRFLEAFPDLSVVLAHWGGGLPFYELMPEIAAATRQVVYDTAASTYLYDVRIFRIVLDLVGPDRVLFGSDFPILRQDRFLQRVLGTPLSGEEMRMVLAENARSVYGLSSDTGAT